MSYKSSYLRIDWLWQELQFVAFSACLNTFVIFLRTQHSSISKLDVSEDNDPGLSKMDVVLTFSLEVSVVTLESDSLT